MAAVDHPARRPLAFWMTDTLHGIRPAWVGLVSACLCLLPRIGFLSGEEFAAGVNVRTRIYLGGILGLPPSSPGPASAARSAMRSFRICRSIRRGRRRTSPR